MAISERDRRNVWTRAAGRCSICKTDVLLDSADASLQSSIGDVAHIVAAKPDGPRGIAPLTDDERNQPSNLMLLCGSDHKLIDSNVKDFTVERLTEIKREHERWVAETLSQAPKIKLKLSNLMYINVPRLGILAAVAGHRVPNLPEAIGVKSLSSLGIELVRVMVAFERVLNGLDIAALEMTSTMTVDARLVGMACSFEARFRTRNMSGRSADDQVAFTGNLEEDPHIYAKLGAWKLVLLINPRWVTTQTAFANFTSGQVKFSGVCFITSVDKSEKIIRASPLVLGHPANPAMDALFG